MIHEKVIILTYLHQRMKQIKLYFFNFSSWKFTIGGIYKFSRFRRRAVNYGQLTALNLQSEPL